MTNDAILGGESERVPIGFWSLVNAVCMDQLDDDGCRQLAAMLRSSAVARQQYLQVCRMHVELRFALCSNNAMQSALALVAAAPSESCEGCSTVATAKRPKFRAQLRGPGKRTLEWLANHKLSLSLLVALAVAAGISARNGWNSLPWAERHDVANLPVAVPAQSPSPSLQDAAPFAQLTRAVDCRWTDAVIEPGQRMKAGQSLHLASGVVEIRFDIGVRVVLQGPASFELQSNRSALLTMGKMNAEIMTKAARGFAIHTPEATYVDQGTEFGVEVSPGGANRIHVFKGEVDLAVGEKKDPSSIQRLTETFGARIEGTSSNVTLLKDTGESFIRTIDESGRDQHTVAYWRFEDQPLGVVLPDTNRDTNPVRATTDSSFNGNDLFTFTPGHGPQFSGNVPAGVVPQTGSANRGCLDNTVPPADGATRDVYSHSKLSHAAPIDLQLISPEAWTIEASVKAKVLHAGRQTFVGRDGGRGGARLAFRINENDRFEIVFFDVNRQEHKAVSDQVVTQNQWYNLAAVSDSNNLMLYVDAMDGKGYQLRAKSKIKRVKHGSTALGKTNPNALWSLGRGRVDRSNSEWFQGWIDEVRISDIAREPDEFLFAAKQSDIDED